MSGTPSEPTEPGTVVWSVETSQLVGFRGALDWHSVDISGDYGLGGYDWRMLVDDFGPLTTIQPGVTDRQAQAATERAEKAEAAVARVRKLAELYNAISRHVILAALDWETP